MIAQVNEPEADSQDLRHWWARRIAQVNDPESQDLRHWWARRIISSSSDRQLWLRAKFFRQWFLRTGKPNPPKTVIEAYERLTAVLSQVDGPDDAAAIVAVAEQLRSPDGSADLWLLSEWAGGKFGLLAGWYALLRRRKNMTCPLFPRSSVSAGRPCQPRHRGRTPAAGHVSPAGFPAASYSPGANRR